MTVRIARDLRYEDVDYDGDQVVTLDPAVEADMIMHGFAASTAVAAPSILADQAFVAAAVAAAVAPLPDKPFVRTTQFHTAETGAFALAAAMADQTIPVDSASGVAVTIPAQATTDLGDGFRVCLWQKGAGVITVSDGAGGASFQIRRAALAAANSVASSGADARVVLTKMPGTDHWIASGDLA